VLSLLVVMVVPFHSRQSLPGPIDESRFAVPLLKGAGYLALALYGAAASTRGRRVRIAELLLIAGLFVGLAQLVLRGPLTFTLTDLSLSMALALALVVLPYYLLRASPALSVTALVTGLGVALAAFSSPLSPDVNPHRLPSLHYEVRATIHTDLIESSGLRRGGALDRFDTAIVLATGDGRFHRLERDASQSLKSRPMPMRIALDQEAFDAATGGPSPGQVLTVTDITLDGSTTPPSLYAAYEHWHTDRGCVTLRVAVAPLAEDGAVDTDEDDWRVVLDTWPCLPPSGLDLPQSGGRLAWLGDQLLVTSGHFALPEVPVPPSQDRSVAYGKVLLVSPHAAAETGNTAPALFSIGHRSPQGLFVDGERVWLTEHGARGGDELNLIERGGNYGYPMVVYGTQYYGETPRQPMPHPGESSLVAPAYAFVPSVAPSNLIVVRGRLFPQWRGDLLIGSLAARSLYRVRLDGQRVVYVEPIRVGYRVRDLIEDGDGRILLWTDEGAIIELEPSSTFP
jgi:hypothetical protein